MDYMLEDFTEPQKVMECRARMDAKVRNPKPTFPADVPKDIGSEEEENKSRTLRHFDNSSDFALLKAKYDAEHAEWNAP
jgi:hypothetical protein